MNRARSLTAALLLAIGPAARLAAQAPPATELPRHFIVAFWYDKTDPARTMRHQAYDLRKKEYYEQPVKAWVADVNEHYPLSHATLRSISLDEWQGETEAQKLERAIEWQKKNMVAIARERSLGLPAILGPYASPSSSSQPLRRPTTTPSWPRSPGSGGLSGSQAQPIPPYLLNRPR